MAEGRGTTVVSVYAAAPRDSHILFEACKFPLPAANAVPCPAVVHQAPFLPGSVIKCDSNRI